MYRDWFGRPLSSSSEKREKFYGTSRPVSPKIAKRQHPDDMGFGLSEKELDQRGCWIMQVDPKDGTKVESWRPMRPASKKVLTGVVVRRGRPSYGQ